MAVIHNTAKPDRIKCHPQFLQNMPKSKKNQAKNPPKPAGQPPKRRRNLWTAVVFQFLFFTFVFGGLDAMLLQDPWSFGIALYLVAALNCGAFLRISNRFRESLVSALLFLIGFAIVLFAIPPVQIAKETTFLTEPKTADGMRIDYEQVLKKVVAPDLDYLSAESFFTQHKDEIPNESPIRLLNRLMENPWTEEDSPPAKRWLDQHALTLDRLSGRDFRVRIQYELGRRNPDKAWDDVLMLFRLSQGQFREVREAADFSGAQVLWNDAFLAAVAVIQHGDFPATQLQGKLAELEPFLNPFTKETGKTILDTERLMILARLQATAWGDNLEVSIPFFKRFSRFFHWNETLRKVNSYFDWIEILESPNYSLVSRFPVRESTSEWGVILKTGMFRTVPDKKGVMEIRIWNDKAQSLVQQLHILRAKSALLQAVFYLEMYRKKHDGKYPATWGELKAKYGEEIPDDPCNTARGTDRSFKYEALGDRYKLYSVGPNGIDENGATWQEKKGSDDITIVK